MKLYVCPNHTTQKQQETAKYCILELEKRCMAECYMSKEDSMLIFGDDKRCKLTPDMCDAVAAVGGDGSVLRAAQCAVSADKPLFGINSGRLGYLCAIDLSEVEDLSAHSIDSLNRSRRSLLGFTFVQEEHFGLNDVVVAKENFGNTVELEVLYRGEELASWRGDGVVIATPTGSTSYNLSAGGPVLLPDSESFVITPICAHTVDVHPIVVSDKYPITVRVKNSAYNSARVYCDGVKIGDINEENLTVRRYEKSLDLLVGNRFCAKLGKDKIKEK